MTFLAPWALVIGAVAAVAVTLLHLVARQRPAAFLLPTARFVPDRRSVVSRVSRRPRDLPLLLLRLLLVLSAAVAFARPVHAPSRVPRGRILLLDRSAAVATAGEAIARARAALGDGVPTRVVVFDTMAVAVGEGMAALDSLSRSPARRGAVGSLSAAIAAGRRLGAAEGAHADSVELVLVSPVTAREIDQATSELRAQWPGGLTLLRLPARSDSVPVMPLARALSSDDVLWPALADVPVARSARAVRVVRTAPDAGDSAFARAGGVVVRWDSIGARGAAPNALAMGDDVIIASLARKTPAGSGAVLARWSDGSPAAVEQRLGEGCVRDVSIGVPVAGDLPLRPAFQRVVRGLVGPCLDALPAEPAAGDSAIRLALGSATRAANGVALSVDTEAPSPIAAWLIAVALLCALAEPVLRARAAEQPA